MSTAADTIEQRLSQDIGDFIEEDTTTNITTNTSVISTALNKWDKGRDDFFNNWWCVFTEGVNFTASTLERQVSDYATATGTLTVRGAALAAEAGAITIRLYRYSQADKRRAINNAIRHIYPELYRHIDNHNIVTGSLLIDGHMEDWSSSSAMTHWTASNATLTKTTTAGYHRGGATSCKVTASAANGYVGQSSNTYRQLLNAMGQTVSAKCWVYPEVANDGVIQIYYVDVDGDATTLSSTTACPAAVWTLLELETQAIPDNITRLDVRCKVTTNAKYAYFDAVRLTGVGVTQHLLPSDFQTGAIEQVYLQTSGYSDDICDDLSPTYWSPIWGSKYIYDGGYKYIELPTSYSSPVQIRLLGSGQLETVSAATDTVSIDDPRLELLVARAKMELFKLLKGFPSSQDVARYNDWLSDAEGEYKELLPSFRMPQRAIHLNMREY